MVFEGILLNYYWQELVDIELFLVSRQVEEALERRDSGPCLAWCYENKSKLRKLKVILQYRVVINNNNNNNSTVYTCVQVERVYKSNPIFEAKNTTFLEKVWFFSFHQLNKINRWSGIQG